MKNGDESSQMFRRCHRSIASRGLSLALAFNLTLSLAANAIHKTHWVVSMPDLASGAGKSRPASLKK